MATCAFMAFFALLTQYLTGRPAIRFAYPTTTIIPVILGPLMIWILVVTLRLFRRGSEKPIATLWRMIRRDRYWIARSLILYTFVQCFAGSFSVFKNHIPQFQPFYLDPFLADTDSFLFFETDPWRITHAIFGYYGTIFLDRLYMFFFPAGLFTLIWVTMSRDRVFQARGLATVAFSWFVLGGFVAVTLSSSGPVFYEMDYGSARFSPLMAQLTAYHAETPLNAIYIGQWLVEKLSKGEFGSGISAMPSLHVGFTFVIWLFVQNRLGWRHPFSWLTAIFAFLMWIASVHLAWHYALDGVVSVVLLSLFWRWTRFLDPEIARPNVAPTLPARAVG